MMDVDSDDPSESGDEEEGHEEEEDSEEEEKEEEEEEDGGEKEGEEEGEVDEATLQCRRQENIKQLVSNRYIIKLTPVHPPGRLYLPVTPLAPLPCMPCPAMACLVCPALPCPAFTPAVLPFPAAWRLCASPCSPST